MNGPLVDTTFWPVVRCTPRGDMTDADYQTLFREFQKLWDKGDKFFVITDTRHSSNASAKQRQLIGDWMKANSASIRRTSLGSVVIVESAIVRGALTAINWIAQPDLQNDYVKSWEQALELALKALEKAGLLTDALRARLKKAV